MKKRMFISLALIVLNLSLFSVGAVAKPAYCDQALSSCTSQCDRIFGWPLNEACRAGCGIGYINCGSNA